MTRRIRPTLISLLIAIIELVQGAPQALGQGRIPNFPLGVAIPDDTGRNGLFWLGGDSPFATYIAPDVSFWAFGDTYLGGLGQGRQINNVVGNTIAIGQIENGNFTPRYFYRGTAANLQAFFAHPDPSYKYWPQASKMINGKLFVFLTRRHIDLTVPLGDTSGTPDTGTVIARVNNPTAIPTIWQIDYLTFHAEGPTTQANLKCGVEILPDVEGDDSLIVYGFFNNPKNGAAKTIVVSISNDAAMNTPANTTIDPSQVQYLAADAANNNPEWKPGLGIWNGPPDDYFDTQIDCVSGFSVRWNAILARWQVVGANSQWASRHPYPPGSPYVPIPYARMFVHPSPFGPFRFSPQTISCPFYKFPELDSPDPTLYCYTVRQWQDPNAPGFNTDANLLMTYTFSTQDVPRQITDPSTYQNHHALVPNPYSGPPTNPPACADGAKVVAAATAATTVQTKNARPDPFGAMGVPKPLPFPPRSAR